MGSNETGATNVTVAVVQKIATVSARGLPDPGHNDWSPASMKQGFSWRRGNVSFEVLEDAGDVPFVVTIGASLEVSPNAFRAIVVPFEIADGGIEIADMYFGSVHEIAVPAGSYALLFEMEHRAASPDLESSEEEPVMCRLTFAPAKDPVVAAIVRRDDGLSPSDPLVLDGKLA